MKRRTIILFVIFLSAILNFNLITAQEPFPDQWKFESQRDEIAPRWWHDSDVQFNGESTLAVRGDNKPYAHGWWTRTVEVKPNTYYQFSVHIRIQQVEEPHRSAYARLLWQDSNGKLLGRAEYPMSHRKETSGGWRLIQQIYKSPEGASQAKLELAYRWDPDGIVHFEQATLKEVPAPESRLVRLSTVNYRPQSDRTLKENLDQFADLIRRAARERADIVCLPEGITLAGSGKTYMEASESVPGPTTKFLGEIARKNDVYIVAGILEREGAAVYNTAVLLDRDGNLAGKYRKVCLPREEYDGGITPGDTFHVFDTDFGRIGIMICWDVFFPEPARTLAMAGAEVILMPIWGGNITLARARAIENQVYLVTSGYDMKTGVFDLEGELLAETTTEPSVVTVEVELGKKKDWPWLGDFKNRIPREMPPVRSMQLESIHTPSSR